MEDEANSKTVIFVIDEMGIGTEPLRKYGYSIIGTPAIGKKPLLYENLTCTCTISLHGPEMI